MTEPVDLTDLADTLDVLRAAKAEVEKWNEVVKAAKEKLQGRLGEAEVGTIDGRPVVKYGRREVTRVNVQALRVAVPEHVLAPYLKTTTERRFELVD